jgi:hypothetical protein
LAVAAAELLVERNFRIFGEEKLVIRNKVRPE